MQDAYSFDELIFDFVNNLQEEGNMKTRSSITLSLVVAMMLSLFVMPVLTASAALPTDMSWVKYSGNPVVNASRCYAGDAI